MAFTKITDGDLVDVGVIGLPDTPGLSTAAMQNKFEETSRSVVIPKHNGLIDELEDTTSAASLGATPLTNRSSSPNVQAVMEKLSTDLKTVEDGMATAIQDAHTHANKALLDTYDQTNADITSAVTNSHTHSNKSLLDTYTQTEANLADAVSKKHDHSNKSLLDTYTQTEANLADAVSKKHAHTNLALLETYTQTEADLAQAVTDDHTHSNKSVIDDLSDDGSGNLLYDGNPVGGGTVNDAYKSIKVGSTTMSASGEDTFEIEAGSNVTLTAGTKKVTIAASGGTPDAYKNIVSAGQTFAASGADTFKINAGSNVTITALSGDKGIQISAAGGGQSTGDMLMADYDSSGTVKTAGGIPAYVSGQIGTLDGSVTGSPATSKTLSAFSETDGVVSATFSDISITKSQVSDFPTLATVATSGSYADLSNKPTLGSAAALDVPTTGNASTTQVVKGDDSRLTDSRTPTSHTHTKSEITDFPTLSVAHSGTASTTTVSKETITLGNTTTDVDGSVYMESTANSASFVFTNSTYILSTSKIDVYSSTWGDNPTSVVVDGTNHTCTVTFSSASSRTVGIYIK